MADLVSTSQAAAFLGEGVDAAVVRGLVDGVQAKLEADCGRADRPFRAAQTGRVERIDGSGRSVLWLDYPIAALTSVVLGYTPATPDETVDLADPEVAIWEVGKRRIARRDGRTFGEAGQAGYIVVTYNAAADLPADCTQAVLRGVAILYGQRGAEDVKSEAVGGYRADLSALDEDPLWKATVERHREVLL